MADIGKAYVEIIPKAPGISGKVANLITPGAKGAGKNAGKDAGEGFGESLKKAIAGLAIGATVGAGFKAALDEGGKLQQSYGGLETIYGDAAEAAKKYAKEAAAAGISANDYAENAVSFGASLKQAFEGDTAKAVEAANTAILDMTDNAAKMGTPIENIQNAYQGFAKGNYTMLDNLKLGYGGTKTEMERLLADAQKLTGVEYNIDNLGDVYAAIHAIQGDLGLTGVAAAEASETFSGSFEAMKASAANLAGALALGEDVGPAMQTLVTSIGTFVFGNLLPMAATIAKSLPEALSGAISAAVPIITEKGPEMITNLVTGIQNALPTLASKGQGIITAVIQGITTYGPTLYTKAVEIISNLANGFMAAFPGIMDKGRELLVNLINGIGAALPQLASKAAEIISSIAEWLAANFPTIAQKGAEMLQSLATAILANIPNVLAAAAKIVVAIGKALIKLAPVALSAAGKLIAGLASGIRAGGAAVMAAAKALVDSKIVTPLKGVVAKAKTVMTNLMSAMVGVWNSIKSKAGTAFEAVKKKITEPIEKAKGLVKSALDKIAGFFPVSIGNIFSNLRLPHFSVTGGSPPWGIGGMGTKPTFSVSWYKKAMAQPYLFDSPTLFGAGEAGDEMMYGRANLMDDIREAVGGTGGTNNVYNINITVDGAEEPEDYARRLARQLQMELRMA